MQRADTNGSAAAPGVIDPGQTVASFREAVIDRFQVTVGAQLCGYQEYLSKPESLRSGDEANAVDQQFARYTLEWLGFSPAEWTYNQPVQGKKANRPDYIIKGSIGTAFIWEDKNSTVNLDDEHLQQMRRYCSGTAGYAVWCNMRRILAIKFLPSNNLKYEVVTDISVTTLFGQQPPLDYAWETQSTSLALFRILFSKERFTQFNQLVTNISIDEQAFERRALSVNDPQATLSFIAGSRQSLEHLRLAALLQIREAIEKRTGQIKQEESLRREWQKGCDELIDSMRFTSATFDAITRPIYGAIKQLTPHVGELGSNAIRDVGNLLEQTATGTSGRLSASLKSKFEKWLDTALRINGSLLALRMEIAESRRIAEAYQIWSERQSDAEDTKPEVFAEQVAYVFFVRLLLVRVLEDKGILTPRIASDGGFLDWVSYIQRHFKELDGISILNQNFNSILNGKASRYYLHFFQQAVFDWFNPDDYLTVETLEFLCRYNFQTVNSDIIGFTYEEYIDRTARNRKGHFLTRQDVVEYMLDLLDYTGAHVIGRRILDPACGSGSFLVHAARRYRRALITYYCNQASLPDSEESINTNEALRKQLAHHYLEDLTSLFFGMELNPFACYLAEMNLFIQAVDDLFVLEQAKAMLAIDRFHIYNTNSLDFTDEILENADISNLPANMLLPYRVSYEMTDEAFGIKTKLDSYADGFVYIISNPPYVSSKQEELDARRFRNAPFYRAILSGDTNLYLLFLRLGLHYLADYGQMIYIVPLTIFGDKSASGARKLLKTPPFSPSAAVRFYRGDILFPGVDQAVGIVRVNRSVPASTMLISGGNTVQEARGNHFTMPSVDVIQATPPDPIWQGSWLVAQNQISWDIWRHVKEISSSLTSQFESLLDSVFDRKQGDVNATFINPMRLGAGEGSFATGDIAIYKGEDVSTYAPLPISPSDWAKPYGNRTGIPSRDVLRASEALEQLTQITGSEQGIILREVARLNTREHLIATWFERSAARPIAFTHKLWRMVLKEQAAEEHGKALLAFINSKTAAYMVNLFSTNNDVGKDNLGRIPIPDPQTFPAARLAGLANELLRERANLDQFVVRFGARLPEWAQGQVYIPPSKFSRTSTLPKLSISAFVGRGEVKNLGPANGRIKALTSRRLIVPAIDPARPYAEPFSRILDLFLRERGRENDTWQQAQNWQLPDVIASESWLQSYDTTCQAAQTSWHRFISLQQQADDAVADWYSFTPSMRAAINDGLPWARRYRDTANEQDVS